jgi:hypothetical protein
MMRSLRMQKPTVAAAMMSILFLIATQALGSMGAGRILPSGQVKVYRGDQLVSVLSEEAPLPEGVLLAPEGQCGMRLDNLFLVADDGSQFSIAGSRAGRELAVRQGTLYFAMSGATGPVAFHTPDGVVTTQRMILKASSAGGLLKGYVDAAPDGTRIGVLEGGTLVVMTPEGEQTIESGRQITLAQANLFDEEQAEGQGAQNKKGPKDQQQDAQDNGKGKQQGAQDDDDDEIPAAYFWGAGGLAALAGIGIAAGGGGGGGGGGFIPPASPSNP